MAVPVFFLGGQFRESLLCGTEVEHRIVAKSACPARRFQDLPVRAIRHDGEGASSFRQRNCTNEVCRALLSPFTAQLSEKFLDSFRIRRIRPRVPCRMHPGRAAESRHCQSRIIGEDQPFLQPRVVQRLAGCIFRECRRAFFERGKRFGVRQQSQFNRDRWRRRRRERAKLREFSRIRRREEKLNGRAH